MTALNCIKCNRELTNREKDNKPNDPWHAVVFESIGNIGSMRYTDEDSIEINLCDDCTTIAIRDGLAHVVKLDDPPLPPIESKKTQRPKLRLIKGFRNKGEAI